MKEKSVEVKIRRTGEILMIKLDQAIAWAKNWIASQHE
jgi:hypothetical protein